MDFTPNHNRGGNSPPPAAHQPPQAHHTKPPRRKHIDWAARTIRIELFILLVGTALLLAAVSIYLALYGSPNSELSRVNKSKFQAVFLNGGLDFTTGTGQPITYFGKLTSVNDKYLVLQNVYYFTPSQSGDQASSPQLVKLGCQQLHAPYDHMVINRNQVAFWENIRDDGRVVEAIKEYEKQNPNGPNCDQPTATPSPSPAPSGSTQ